MEIEGSKIRKQLSPIYIIYFAGAKLNLSPEESSKVI